MGGMIRAVVVDDEPLARDGVKLHLAREPDVQVVGEAADGRRAIGLITSSGRHLLRITMAELEKRLDPRYFARIHRSTMVNVERIKEITPAWHGDFEVLLHDGQRLRLSRNFRDRLLP